MTSTCTAVPGGVCRAAFTSRFSTTRSTLPGSTSTMTASARTRTGCSFSCAALRHHAASQLPDVGGFPLGVDLSSIDAIEVEQVVDQAVHLPAALLDHLVERLAFVGGQVQHVVTTDRLHRPEDPGERALQVVRHGVQQRVLHVVHLTQVARTPGLLLDQAPLRVDDRAERVEEHRGREEHGEPDDAVPVGHRVGGGRRGDDRTSVTRAATVETITATAPQRRPRFHVTSPIGMRYRSGSESLRPGEVVEHAHHRDEGEPENGDEQRGLPVEEALAYCGARAGP